MRAALALVFVLASGEARANPADIFGFGARGAAMGGAHAAAAEDASANYYNPALLADADAIRIDLGYQLGAPTLRAAGRDQAVASARGTTAALAVPGTIGGVSVALGAGVLLPDQHLSRTRTLAASTPRFVYYDNRPQRLFLAANAAVRLGALRLGAGISYMSSTRGSVELTGRIGFPDAADSDLVLDIDVDLRTIRYAQLGAAYALRPWLDVALTYRSEFALTLDQAFAVRGDVGLAEAPVVENGFLELRSVSMDLFQPAQLTAGVRARLTGALTLAFDLAWHRWSRFANPAATIDLALDVGDFNDMVSLPPPVPLPEPRFSDIAVPRLGLEWQGPRLAVRAGYVYEPSPAPGQYGESNFIDNDKHTASLGTGWTVAPRPGGILLRPFSIDGFVAITALERRVYRKLSPVDPVGDYSADGHVLAAGLSSRWQF